MFRVRRTTLKQLFSKKAQSSHEDETILDTPLEVLLRDRALLERALRAALLQDGFAKSELIWAWLEQTSKRIKVTRGYLRREDREEIVSEAFFAIINSKARYDPSQKPSSWLIKIFQNTTRNYLKRAYYTDLKLTDHESESSSSRNERRRVSTVFLINQIIAALKKHRVQTALDQMPAEKVLKIYDLVEKALFDDPGDFQLDVTKTYSGEAILDRVLRVLAEKTKDDTFLIVDRKELLKWIRKK